MTELSDESKALIESEAHLDEATAAEIEAMRVRVVAALVAAPLAGAAVGHAGAVSKGTTAAWLKILGLTAAGAVGSSALLLALSEPAAPVRAPAPSASVAVAPSPSTTARAPVSVAPAPVVSAPVAVSAPVHAPASSRPAPSMATAASEEALLVATAEAQLRAGHPSAALALYEQQLREYPRGALRQESESGRILALCSLGRKAEGRAALVSFAQRYPASPTLERMHSACADVP